MEPTGIQGAQVRVEGYTHTKQRKAFIREHGRKAMSATLFRLIEETLGVQPNALLRSKSLPRNKIS